MRRSWLTTGLLMFGILCVAFMGGFAIPDALAIAPTAVTRVDADDARQASIPNKVPAILGAPGYTMLDLSGLIPGEYYRSHCLDPLPDGTVVFLVGADGAEFTARLRGDHVAISGQGEEVDVHFSPPVSYVASYTCSDPGFEDEPPIATCYGHLYYETDTYTVYEEIEYQFGPGLTRDSYSSVGQFASGTPNNDEFHWDRCTFQGTNWYIVVETYSN